MINQELGAVRNEVQETFEKLQVVFANFSKNMEKVSKGNKAAHRRARKNMLDIKSLSHEMRKHLMEHVYALPPKPRKVKA